MSLDPITAGLDLLSTLARIVESAQAGQTTPAEAIAAARKALGPDPLAGMAAEDAARHARLAELGASRHEWLEAMARENAAHAARVERSDEPTVELPLPASGKP